MPDIRRLLVALDLQLGGRSLTPGSATAADQAFELATRLGSEVLLLHSTASDEVWDGERERYVAVSEALESERLPMLEDVADRFHTAGIAITVATTSDTAGLGIIRFALRERADLVLAGRRRERSQAGLGSVALRLLRMCPCPVWVAKPGVNVALRSIVAATDLSPVGERVVGYAAFAAELFGAELHVVHAFQLPLVVQMQGEEQIEEFERRERDERTRSLQAQIAQTRRPLDTLFHVGCTSPSHAVLEANERFDPDLVVMGTISRAGLPGLLVGNTAERLLGRLDCSLLAIKPAEFVCPIPPAE